jgi:hypothetical protein
MPSPHGSTKTTQSDGYWVFVGGHVRSAIYSEAMFIEQAGLSIHWSNHKVEIIVVEGPFCPASAISSSSQHMVKGFPVFLW